VTDPSDPTQVNPPPPPGPAAPPPPPPGGAPHPVPPGDGGRGGSNRKPLLIGGAAVAVIALIIGGVVVLSGGDDDGSRVGSVDDVKLATVQIVAEGAFVDPVEGAVQAAGSGTGFIIDESGLAVTNNHVVTGAASVQVFVGGEDEERDAEILGVSECSDLAVIDIEGDGYPVLEWASADPDVGTDVFVAGFPLGDPEYTLTEGIISKAEAAVDTDWASVEGALETTAKINPGNSGGPLVGQDGKVVGVNYASDDTTDQNLSIKGSLAQEVIEVLRTGDDQEALGMNTQAVVSEDGSASGIFVSAVSAGTPAADAGVEAGDIIAEMNDVPVGEDGTMGGYCDIVRSAGAGGAIAVTVVRPDTGEILEGEFNGSPLEVVGSTGGGPVPDAGGDTQVVTSENGTIAAQVPAGWEAALGPDGFDVGPDVDAFSTSFAAAGASVRLLPEQPDDVLIATFIEDIGGVEICQELERSGFETEIYVGTEVTYDCGGTDALLSVGTSGSGSSVLVFLQATTPVEIDQGNLVLNSVEEL
jgi:serine protease Do